MKFRDKYTDELRFNTASGMDCMQFECDNGFISHVDVSIPQAVWIACNIENVSVRREFKSFNTASGMDCMQFKVTSRPKNPVKFQYRKRYGLHAILITISMYNFKEVSIPQAVWIACNSDGFAVCRCR